MKVTIRIRLTPLRSPGSTARPRKARPERVRPFASQAPLRRGFQPLAVWAMTVLLMVGFMSVSMFATLSPVPEEVVQLSINEEDPALPIVGTVVTDCRVMLETNGRLSCLPAMEYREDSSGAVALSPGSSTQP